MAKEKFTVCSIMMALFWFSPSSGASEEANWILRSKDLQCIITNAERYLALPDKKLIIVAPACPEVDLKKALASRIQNAALPTVDAHAEFDEIIVVSHDYLKCLQAYQADSANVTVKVSKSLTCK